MYTISNGLRTFQTWSVEISSSRTHRPSALRSIAGIPRTGFETHWPVKCPVARTNVRILHVFDFVYAVLIWPTA